MSSTERMKALDCASCIVSALITRDASTRIMHDQVIEDTLQIAEKFTEWIGE